LSSATNKTKKNANDARSVYGRASGKFMVVIVSLFSLFPVNIIGAFPAVE